jgi:hypoxanthine phosphoribosyltransferase
MNNRYSIIFSLVLCFILSSLVLGFIHVEHAIKKTYVDFEQIKSMCTDIHKQVQTDDFEPDLLVGICRGGLIPLGLLAGEAMFNNRNIVTISTESYDDTGNQKALRFRFPVHVEDYKKYKAVLIIDDLADTGETLDAVTKLLKEHMPDATIKSAVLFYKIKSKVKPDYYAKETADWIVFPWEQWTTHTCPQ